MAVFVSSLVLCLAASASALQPVQPSVEVNPKLSYSEWVDVLGSQVMVPETCDGCRVGTEPQPDVAGRVAEGVVEPRIIGGQVASPGQFPWQAQVRMDDRFFCGGSVISDQWILTAGHCGSGYSMFTIVLGSFYSQNTNEPHKVTVVSREAQVHEGYDPFMISNDIAVIRLPAKLVAWSDYIRPVRLPSLSEATSDFAGVAGVLSGWGRYGSSTVSPSISPVLRFVELTTLANTECAQSFGTAIRPTNICTSGKGIKGACNGDSGGALTVESKNGSRIQLGIVSFGTSRGCNKEYPSAYTRVTAFLKWMSDKTNIAITK